jgi:hypothetical protein
VLPKRDAIVPASLAQSPAARGQFVVVIRFPALVLTS